MDVGSKMNSILGRSEHTQRALSLAQQCGNKMAEAAQLLYLGRISR